jgi:hypothetical protein
MALTLEAEQRLVARSVDDVQANAPFLLEMARSARQVG